MAYVRAVWFEEDTEQIFTGAAPSNWIINGYMYWPPRSKESSAFKRLEIPSVKTWKRFKIIKEKLRTDDLNLAENMPDTTAGETEDEPENANAGRYYEIVFNVGYIRILLLFVVLIFLDVNPAERSPFAVRDS